MNHEDNKLLFKVISKMQELLRALALESADDLTKELRDELPSMLEKLKGELLTQSKRQLFLVYRDGGSGSFFYSWNVFANSEKEAIEKVASATGHKQDSLDAKKAELIK